MFRLLAILAIMFTASAHATTNDHDEPTGEASLYQGFEPSVCVPVVDNPYDLLVGDVLDELPWRVEPPVAEPKLKWWQFGKKKKARATLVGAQLKHLERVNYLHPDLRHRVQIVYAGMRAQGYDMRSAEGFRSPERQEALMSNGKGVTSVGAMRSCHQYGLALDSVLVRNGKPQWNMKDPWTQEGYRLFGELSEREGLTWGGRWTHPKDYVHVELNKECRTAKHNPEAYIATVITRIGASVHLAAHDDIEMDGPLMNPSAAVVPLLLALQPNGPVCRRDDTLAADLWMPALTPLPFPLG